jgi:hypothetical protein
MKITAIETFAVNTGPPRPWLFCGVRTDEGLTGYSEFGSEGITRGLVGLGQDLGERSASERSERWTDERS